MYRPLTATTDSRLLALGHPTTLLTKTDLLSFEGVQSFSAPHNQNRVTSACTVLPGGALGVLRTAGPGTLNPNILNPTASKLESPKPKTLKPGENLGA